MVRTSGLASCLSDDTYRGWPAERWAGLQQRGHLNYERRHWLEIGLLLTSLAAVVLGLSALSGFAVA
jgi:hypothetical protein